MSLLGRQLSEVTTVYFTLLYTMFLSFRLKVQYKWNHQENSHLEMKIKNEGFIENSIATYINVTNLFYLF